MVAAGPQDSGTLRREGFHLRIAILKGRLFFVPRAIAANDDAGGRVDVDQPIDPARLESSIRVPRNDFVWRRDRGLEEAAGRDLVDLTDPQIGRQTILRETGACQATERNVPAMAAVLRRNLRDFVINIQHTETSLVSGLTDGARKDTPPHFELIAADLAEIMTLVGTTMIDAESVDRAPCPQRARIGRDRLLLEHVNADQ